MGANELDVYNIRKRLHEELLPLLLNHSEAYMMGVYMTLHILSDITGVDFQITPRKLAKYARK